MQILLLIALGGALGAVLRFGLGLSVTGWSGPTFPYATLVVNILGSLVMGFLFFYLNEKTQGGDMLRGFLLVGLLGGFTTFSAFSLETLLLLTEGAYLRSLLNVFLSVTLCIGAAALGMLVARQF